MKCEEVVVEFDVGEVEGRHPSDGGHGVIECRAQLVGQGNQFGCGRHPVEPTDSDVDRVDRSATDHIEDRVSGLLQRQAPLDGLPIAPGEGNRIREPQKVGCVQEVDVQHVTGNPLAAVQKSPQIPHRVVEFEFACLLDGIACAHLVGDRADTADTRGDVRGSRKWRPRRKDSKKRGGS